MIHHSAATLISFTAVCHLVGNQISAVKGAWAKDYGLLGHIACLHGAANLSARDWGNGSDQQFDLPIGELSIFKPLVGQRQFGERLRIWWQGSGRYGCFTVPREV